MRIPILTTFALIPRVLMLCAAPALAHYPFCTCEADGDEITCTGGFSDGSSAQGVTLDVISYDEEVLVPGKFGEESRVSFPAPEGEFYILFDAGPGHVLEVDYPDIEGFSR
ncbi:hypothetical protein PE067_16595 [Paracoccus sp. DMF-8]|uniref:hypothetical protein n=1 Tax=Paracoccus sp. DMF-8 TaxID=3019445 RepID=UPI0023E3622B|nr:hypothetical protein [Paracoccus sp. DMF-8]MDF3607623.1 hypothetical protein [Paracoccus sp. DMF-8]